VARGDYIMELKGRITKISPIKTGMGSNGVWKSQYFVLEELNAQYPNKFKIDMFNKDFDFLVGDIVTVSVNGRVKEVEGIDYPSLSMWKIEKDS